MGVGACHDDELVVDPGVHGGFDSVAHFVGADEFFAGAMPAALGLHLVFQVAAAGSGPGQIPDRAGDLKGAAPTGVGIHQERQVGRLDDAPGRLRKHRSGS